MSVAGVPSVNLLPERWVRARRSAKAFTRWGTAAALSLVVVALPAALAGAHLRSAPLPDHVRVDQLTEEIRAIRSEISGLDRRRAMLRDDRGRVMRARRRVQWASVVEPVFAMLPEGARITSLGGAVRDSVPVGLALTMTIVTDAQAPARELLVTIEESGLFDVVEMVETSRVRDGVVSTIRVRVRPADAGGDAG